MEGEVKDRDILLKMATTEMEREVRECKASNMDGGYFSMEGDGAYAHK